MKHYEAHSATFSMIPAPLSQNKTKGNTAVGRGPFSQRLAQRKQNDESHSAIGSGPFSKRMAQRSQNDESKPPVFSKRFRNNDNSDSHDAGAAVPRKRAKSNTDAPSDVRTTATKFHATPLSPLHVAGRFSSNLVTPSLTASPDQHDVNTSDTTQTMTVLTGRLKRLKTNPPTTTSASRTFPPSLRKSPQLPRAAPCSQHGDNKHEDCPQCEAYCNAMEVFSDTDAEEMPDKPTQDLPPLPPPPTPPKDVPFPPVAVQNQADSVPANAQTYYENSSRSNASSIAAQQEMRTEKAEAGLRAFKGYDYRIECEAHSPRSVDPVRIHFQKRRLQHILAVSKKHIQSSSAPQEVQEPVSRLETPEQQSATPQHNRHLQLPHISVDRS